MNYDDYIQVFTWYVLKIVTAWQELGIIFNQN